jgi:hypothetical protein
VTTPRRAMIVNPWRWRRCVVGTHHACHEHIIKKDQIFGVSYTVCCKSFQQSPQTLILPSSG